MPERPSITSAELTKAKVREQFGANAENYATSEVHAKGASLGRLIELVAPRADWKALDIATAAGHTALVVAPHVAEVVATDLTQEMLVVAAGIAADRGIENVTFEVADAEDLHFDSASFDLVTCRIAPHHFFHPDRFVAEARRVLRPGGTFALVDNIVPDDPDVAAFANRWEGQRDPSHVRCLSLAEWESLLDAVGFTITTTELALKRMDFTVWAENMSVGPDLRAQLRHELDTAPAAVKAFLRPEPGAFHLTEGLIIATA